MLRLCTMPNGRWQHSDCPLPHVRPWFGGRPNPGSVGCVPRISCSIPMPLALRTSRLWSRRRSWPWPVNCRPVQKGQGCQPEFYVIQQENSQRCMVPLDMPQWRWNSRGLIFGSHKCRNMEPLLLQRRKLPSSVRNLSHHRPPRPHPSQNTQRSLNPQSPQSRLMLSPWNPLTECS